MRYAAFIGVFAGALVLGACGGSPKEERAESIEENAERQADAIEEKAENAPPALREEAEFNAGLTREAGEIQAEAIRDSEGKAPETNQ